MKPYLFLLVTSLSLGSTATRATEIAPDINVKLKVYRVVEHTKGRVELTPTTTAKPGDVLEYRSEYMNRGDQTARGLVGRLPIPEGQLEYIADPKSDTRLRASVDGKHYEALPLMRTVIQADGAQVQQAIPFTEYRFLAWDLGDLPRHGQATTTARLRMLDSTSNGKE